MTSWQIMWRRFDRNGLDACRVVPDGTAWIIEGAAVFGEDGQVASLSYRICCAPDWATRNAEVAGWIGGCNVRVRLARKPEGEWTANGQKVDGANGLIDVDLGFTPASNTNAIRRLGLSVGERTETTALWLDTSDWRMKPLTQVYERVSAERYAYASPLHSYSAELDVNEFGIVRNYPGLWTVEKIACL